jgi:hypothetical protein
VSKELALSRGTVFEPVADDSNHGLGVLDCLIGYFLRYWSEVVVGMATTVVEGPKESTGSLVDPFSFDDELTES